jgi:hypothetical protein
MEALKQGMRAAERVILEEADRYREETGNCPP